jgi:crotonobetainyl-CoA:carnitine CoA-transferase CaiB-like acyl-CoA transferase
MSDKRAGGASALSGVRIIDFGAGAIDPLATSYLADFGAEVIKVESYSKLDFMRGSEIVVGGIRDPDSNISFGRYNQNKMSVLINLKHPQGIALAKKLISLADVVIENFRLGVMPRLGLGYEELRKIKPDIIMLSASFGGQTGPYRDFGGQGTIIATLLGVNEITGWPDRWPAIPGAAFCDHYMPFMCAVIIMASLEYRRRTGKGQFIDASSIEGCLDVLDTATVDYGVNKRILKRRGNRHPTAAPHGVYRCQGDDRWCTITVFTDKEWQSFCRVLGNPDWTAEERFCTLLGRLGNVDELDKLVENWTIRQKAEEVMLKLQAAGIAAGVVKNAKDIYEDPQMIYREHFWEFKEPGMEAFTFEAPSVRMSKTPARLHRRYPFLGEHNSYVYDKLLGLDAKEYAQLVEDGVIS